MITKKNLSLLKKQHYGVVGKHSAVQICTWTKNSLRGIGSCYKQKFYGIKSGGCCEMSPSAVWCDNKCIHCWRAIECTQGNKIKGKIDSPEEIIQGCIEAREKLLSGFKGNSKTKLKDWQQSQEPSHWAISLIGEPTLYPKLGELINELRKQGNTTFVVSNGLHPKILKKLEKKKQLPTQLYVSLNTTNRKDFEKWHRSQKKDAWKLLNESLDIIAKLKDRARTVLRMTLVKELNMQEKHVEEYAEIIKKAQPLFVEVKGFVSVGFARKRLGYDKMPTYKEIKDYAKKIIEKLGKRYAILGEHKPSKIVLVGKKADKKRMKIKKKEI